jgi:sulfonate transport system permease protein
MKWFIGNSEAMKGRLRGMTTVVILLAAWGGVSRAGLIAPDKFPPPYMVVKTFIELATSGLLVKSLASSLVRIIEGFAVGTSLGFIMGAAMGVSKTTERLFSPLINSLRQVPVIGWIPLVILWCGVNDLSKVAFIAIGSFFPMAVCTFQGIRGVPGRFIEVVRVFEFSKLRLLARVVVPGALPDIVTGIRLSLGTSWMLVVWSEINTRSGLGIGEMLWSARMGSKLDVVLICIIVIGLVAYLINEVLGHVEARLLVWKKSYR